jgi:hypothetical protein
MASISLGSCVVEIVDRSLAYLIHPLTSPLRVDPILVAAGALGDHA